MLEFHSEGKIKQILEVHGGRKLCGRRDGEEKREGVGSTGKRKWKFVCSGFMGVRGSSGTR